MKRVFMTFLVTIILAGISLPVYAGTPQFWEENIKPFEEGAYWKYEVEVKLTPDETLGGMLTFIVIETSELLTVDNNAIAVIIEMEEEYVFLRNQVKEMVFLTAYMHSSLPIRWPLPVEFLPGMEFLIPNAKVFASLPVGLLGQEIFLDAKIDTLPPAQYKEQVENLEKVNLSLTYSQDVAVIAGKYTDVLVVDYEGSFVKNIHGGRAWFAPDTGWWVKAEGEYRVGGQEREYIIDLLEWGLMEEKERNDFISRVYGSMQKQSPELADQINHLLEELNIIVQ